MPSRTEKNEHELENERKYKSKWVFDEAFRYHEF